MTIKNRKMADTIEEATSTMTDHARDTLTNVNSSLIRVIDQNRAITQNLLKAMQEESLRFVNTRLEHTTRAFERSRECQGVSALIALQHDWLMDIARDYAELNKRMGEVLHDMTEQTVDEVAEAMSEPPRRAQKPETSSERAAAA